MKTKIFALFAAMMLLVGTTAMAQSDDTKNTSTTETSLKGDVNADGVVDVADIAAVIAVMHEQGTVETKYYWYAGWTEPTEANIGELVNKQLPTNTAMTTFTNAGKTSTTTSGVTFDLLTTRLVDDEYPSSKVKRNYYIVVPTGQGIYDSDGTALHLDNAFATQTGTFTNHIIYKSTATSVTISAFIIK